MRSYGYIRSKLTGDELSFTHYTSKVQLPSEYTLKNLKSISDQGNQPICVSVSLNTILDWKLKIHNDHRSYSDSIFYDLNTESTKFGMTPKDAFKILAESKGDLPNGYNTYAMVHSTEMAKRAIIQNGPLMIALPVKSNNNDFWNGSDNLGAHAVTLIGYNTEGFILRNSWGISYGNDGYYIFPYNDFSKVYEAWTLIS